MNQRFLLPTFLILSAHASACSGADDALPANEQGRQGTLEPFSVLSYNIGNPDDTEPNYPLRLSYQVYEDSVAQTIRSLEPDIVLLQEVLPPQTCEAFEEEDEARTCFDSEGRPTAAQRVLGDEYTIACDARLHVESVSARVSDLSRGLSSASSP